MKIVDWQFYPSFRFGYDRARNNVDVAGKWWPEWYVFIGPLQIRIWGTPR